MFCLQPVPAIFAALFRVYVDYTQARALRLKGYVVVRVGPPFIDYRYVGSRVFEPMLRGWVFPAYDTREHRYPLGG
jgi:hypothetical protein